MTKRLNGSLKTTANYVCKIADANAIESERKRGERERDAQAPEEVASKQYLARVSLYALCKLNHVSAIRKYLCGLTAPLTLAASTRSFL